jgi:hypothetical protein
MATPCDQSNKDLFAACTTISLGNREVAKFWSDKWLSGQAPRQLAPLLFALAARKNLTVKEVLTNGRWMRGLQRINTETQLDQFVSLWSLIQTVTLTDDRDSIAWNITADGKYSASSAYEVQFFGRLRQPHLEQVWHIRAEGKIKFFFWLMLQNRNWTAERLCARGLPHDAACCLCDQDFETAAHLGLHCPFAKEVWIQFQSSHPRAVQIASVSTSISSWWAKLRRGKPSKQKKGDISMSVYAFWHIWKECGRRIFQSESLSAIVVASLIRADLDLLHMARDRT